MKSSHRTAKSRTSAARRAQLLAAFERSGLSAAAFARQHGLASTPFCGWRHRRAKTKPSPEFVQVELPAAPAPVELLIGWGARARLRLTSTGQLDLVARLIQALRPPKRHTELSRAPQSVPGHHALRPARQLQWPVGRRTGASG